MEIPISRVPGPPVPIRNPGHTAKLDQIPGIGLAFFAPTTRLDLISCFLENAMKRLENEASGGGLVPLHRVPHGKKVKVCRLEGEPNLCHRLREMGFCEEAEVSVVRNCGALICQVCGSKVGLSSRLAEFIHVNTGSEG